MDVIYLENTYQRLQIESMHRRLLLLLLLFSCSTRASLALLGGQLFFGDEGRFAKSQQVYQCLIRGDGAGALKGFSTPDHLGYVAIGVVGVALQHVSVLGSSTFGEWSENPERQDFTINRAAAFLSVAGMLGVLLAYLCVRKAGGDELEAVIAASLMALSSTNLYTARHLLPYDWAIVLMLLAAWLALNSKRLLNCLMVGIVAGVAFHVYNGYWFMVPLLALAPAFFEGSPGQRFTRVFYSGLGSVFGVFSPYLLGVLLFGGEFLSYAVAFSGTVTQGVFSEGWSLPWEFLYHSESFFGLGVFIFLGWALCRRKGYPNRVALWILYFLGAYGLLVFASCFAHCFVVYARTVKLLLPLLCFLGAWAIREALPLMQSRRLAWIGVAVLVFAALSNMIPFWGMAFPRELELDVLRAAGNPKRVLTYSGSIYIPLAMPVRAPALALVNTQLVYPIRDFEPLPAGEFLLLKEHPLSVKLFQYESHTPRQRALLRKHGIVMGLMHLKHPSSVPDNPPQRLWFSAQDRSDGLQ